MDVLMARLKAIREECLPEDEKKKSAKKEKVDPFTAAKEQITGELRDIRNLLKERDQQEAENPGSTYAVELAHNVRMSLARVQEDAQKMERDLEAKRKKYETKAAKTKKTDETLEQQFDVRGKVLGVIKDHIEECSSLEKKRYGGGPGVASSSSSKPTDPTVTSLPDIDDPRFQQLIKSDQEIEDLLGVLGKNVAQLGELARTMNDEAKKQSKQLDELEVDIDRADAKVKELNARIKVVIEQLRPGSKFCIDFILVCILLGLGGLIYQIVASR